MVKQFKNYFSRWFKSDAVRWIEPAGMVTDISIYNHTVKKKVPFILSNKGYISWYACGPTVYDSTHIGHACSYIRLDIIRRILEKYLNTNIVQVMCVTNIDDKIIERSKSTNTCWKELTVNYEKEFFSDLAVLNVKSPSVITRAVDFVPQIIRFIEHLLAKNLAYRSCDGAVYFSIDNYGQHGKLKPIEKKPERINQSENILIHKRNPADFVLWKQVKQDEPYWRSPWGLGRPGWHISCSAMASEYFGNKVDIHSGGIDLMFPHHENEESQCCAFHNVNQWVDYWLHTGFLSVKEEKMSKSLGNTITVRDYLKANSPNYLRMLCLSTHYRSNVDFVGEDVILSRKLCARFYEFFDNCRAYVNGYSLKGDIDVAKLLEIFEETKKNVDASLKDDFNTKECIHLLDDLMTVTNSMIFADTLNGVRNVATVCCVSSYVEEMMEFFGFNFSDRSISETDVDNVASHLENIIDASVSFRNEVRNLALGLKKSKNTEIKDIHKNLLTLCDDFRGKFNHFGVALKDRKDDMATWNFVKLDAKDKKSGEFFFYHYLF
ncbi:hypothetical protein V9T40_007321 [Parthenolecanium corni]|uniref:cysteine--tRNA ligase n=1 Tax=Parthenolecanium corni TaxID=536013 RepID=A0AAN9Y9P5_9HEMI